MSCRLDFSQPPRTRVGVKVKDSCGVEHKTENSSSGDEDTRKIKSCARVSFFLNPPSHLVARVLGAYQYFPKPSQCGSALSIEDTAPLVKLASITPQMTDYIQVKSPSGGTNSIMETKVFLLVVDSLSVLL